MRSGSVEHEAGDRFARGERFARPDTRTDCLTWDIVHALLTEFRRPPPEHGPKAWKRNMRRADMHNAFRQRRGHS